MHHNYEQIKVDFEALEKCCESIKNAELNKIAQTVKKNIEEIAATIAMPHFLMRESVRQLKSLQYRLEGAVANKINIEPKTEEHKKLLNNFVKDKLKTHTKEHSEEARELLKNLRMSNPLIEEAINTQALNSLVNVWTIFESISKDIWICLLNNHQAVFLNNILDSKTEGEIEGISGKLISISFLGKYGFNLNNKLGDILVGKYDFTSCSGIKKAFVDLNKSNKTKLDFLDNSDLFKLEVLRNLIVHKAGVIDELFLTKCGLGNDLLGQRIVIENEIYESYETAAIHSIVKLLEYSDELVNYS